MLRTTVLAATLILLAGEAFGQSGSLELVIGGEAYDGPPRFEVSFNGEALGEGTIEAAIDTAEAGRFADAPVKTAYLQSFSFAIPEGSFDPMGQVRVRFLNEAFGGDGSNRDRNLFIAAVSVNGREVPGPQMQTMSGTALEPSAVLGDYLVLFDGTADAVAPAPEEGWPQPGAATGSTSVPQPAEDAAETAVVEASPPPATEQTPAVATVAEAADSAAPAETPAPTAEAIETSGGEGCALDQLYNVLGFNENSNEVTPRVEARLDQVLKDIGSEQCVVSVIGYSSTVGDYATNALFAVERAQNVLAYLRTHGLRVAKATATGAGETEQFGASPAANRRVVITVSP